MKSREGYRKTREETGQYRSVDMSWTGGKPGLPAPRGQKEKDQSKTRTSCFCRTTMESAKDFAQGPRDKKETLRFLLPPPYTSLLCTLGG